MTMLDDLSPAVRVWGQVAHCDGTAVKLAGLGGLARIGDGVVIRTADGAGAKEIAVPEIRGEIIALGADSITAILMAPPQGLAVGQRAYLVADRPPRPCEAWLGLVVDAFGRLADGRPAPQGNTPANLRRTPPRGERRRALGPRLATGQSALDTLLPLCRGQRLGVFAGSGVGKSMLMTGLAQGVEADVVVVGLIGERGREVSEFTRNMLGDPAMARTVVIASTSDQTALVKRRAALLCLAVAEHFRDQGRHVLCLFDSVTRFAEAHREIALAAGEAPALRAFPPSTPQVISALCERAGPGEEASGSGVISGDITGIFTVLVSGSDMDEPVADMVRGVLDGHVVLERAIAERGRFPAIDLRRSVSRSAPMAWSEQEAELAARARALIARYEEAEPMIQAGLYTTGTDPAIDEAIALWPALDRFVGASAQGGSDLESFARLKEILDQAGHVPAPASGDLGDIRLGRAAPDAT